MSEGGGTRGFRFGLPAVAQFGPKEQDRLSCLVLKMPAHFSPVAPQTIRFWNLFNGSAASLGS